mmetsp:Transcript_39975/g.52288  ORF Transcript_39975/g.52288 Transcript_39975/m.52288 type:complete len:209 (+) Transcript_39975:1885-2511(+)
MVSAIRTAAPAATLRRPSATAPRTTEEIAPRRQSLASRRWVSSTSALAKRVTVLQALSALASAPRAPPTAAGWAARSRLTRESQRRLPALSTHRSRERRGAATSSALARRAGTAPSASEAAPPTQKAVSALSACPSATSARTCGRSWPRVCSASSMQACRPAGREACYTLASSSATLTTRLATLGSEFTLSAVHFPFYEFLDRTFSVS